VKPKRNGSGHFFLEVKYRRSKTWTTFKEVARSTSGFPGGDAGKWSSKDEALEHVRCSSTQKNICMHRFSGSLCAESQSLF